MTRIQLRIPIVNINWIFGQQGSSSTDVQLHALYCFMEMLSGSPRSNGFPWPNPLESGFGENLLGVIMVGNGILLEGGEQNLSQAEKYHTLDNLKPL